MRDPANFDPPVDGGGRVFEGYGLFGVGGEGLPEGGAWEYLHESPLVQSPAAWRRHGS